MTEAFSGIAVSPEPDAARTTETPFRRVPLVRRLDLAVCAVVCGWVVLFMFQINQPPFERYPAWDIFWGNVLQAGKLGALKHALLGGELPAINPYVGFGWNNLGETALPQSFLFPLNLLILLWGPSTVITIRTGAMLMVAGVGVYLYVLRHTGNRFGAFVAALTYASLPFVFSMNYYYSILNTFCWIPAVLLLIDRFVERRSAVRAAAFALVSVLAVASSEVHVFILLPAVILVYCFTGSRWRCRGTLGRAGSDALLLLILFLLSSAFYLVPLFVNLSTNSQATKAFQVAGLASPPEGMPVAAYLRFFCENGIETLFKPNEGSGLLMYAPMFVYVAVLVSVVFRRHVFAEKPGLVAAPIALVGLGLSMIAASIGFYAMPASISSLGRGVLRYHMNLLPFVGVLAGFVCLPLAARAKGVHREILLTILALSFIAECLLFVIPYPVNERDIFAIFHANEAFPSSNVVPVRFTKDLWRVLPLLNLAVPALVWMHVAVSRSCRPWATPVKGALVVAAFLLPLLTASVHNELRANQQAHWQRVTRSDYNWTSYVDRQRCLDRLSDRRDPNYRTLPAGKDWEGRGRNWKLIAETEMQSWTREKMLFIYRETMHPFEAVMYSSFGGGFLPSNWMPPPSPQVAANLDMLRLMGVKWVVSADARIDSPDLAYVGECSSPEAKLDPQYSAGGVTYLYQLRNPARVAFLASQTRYMDTPNTLQAIFVRRERPWTQQMVYLEGDVRVRPGPPLGAGELATIRRESFSAVDVDVSALAERGLVLTYVYRPGWRAYIDSRELKIGRAYGGFMVVAVPPGRSLVRFRYTPSDVRVGLGLTALAFVVPGVIGYRRRRTAAAGSSKGR